MSTPRNAVGWFELYVTDMARAKTFYQGVFQRDLSDLPMPDGMPTTLQMCTFEGGGGEAAPGASGALVAGGGMAPGSGGTLVYFSCADVAVESARVEPHGGKICQDKMPIGPYGFIAIVMDTEGNTIGLHSMA